MCVMKTIEPLEQREFDLKSMFSAQMSFFKLMYIFINNVHSLKHDKI